MEMAATVRPLTDLEAVIERGLTTFVEVGQALLEIREHRLYRETHESFETYCRERWNWSRQRAHQMIEASSVSTMVDTDSLNERQARELARLKDEPEAIREVWSEVKEERGDAVTAADVRSAVDRRLGVERPQPTRRAPDPDFADDYVENVNQDRGEAPPGYTAEAWVYEQATRGTAADTGTDPDEESVEDAATEPAAPLSLPNTQAMRDAYLRADFLKCVTKVSQIAAYAPERVAMVLPPDEASAAEQTLTRLADWLAQFRAERSRAFRVMGE